MLWYMIWNLIELDDIIGVFSFLLSYLDNKYGFCKYYYYG